MNPLQSIRVELVPAKDADERWHKIYRLIEQKKVTENSSEQSGSLKA